MIRNSWWFGVPALLGALLVLPNSAVAQSAETLRCEDGQRVGSRGCDAELYLMEVLESRGVAAAMAQLDILVAGDDDMRRDAHNYAHHIGIAAYTGQADVGEVFNDCTPAYQSGCYHGVIQSYFAAEVGNQGELRSAMVNDLCREQREDPEERWLLFQCAHGMGHGLVMVADRHLPTALEGCDLVQDAWERESCYGGAFMENIVHETAPHHAVGRPEMHEGGHGAHAQSGAAHDDHAGHDVAERAAPHAEHVESGGHAEHQTGTVSLTGAADREPFPALDPNDPFYPCSELDDRYAISCFQMQTSAILYHNGYDVRAAAATCATAPGELRPVCFQSLGRDISSMTGQDHRRAATLCAHASDDDEPWCHLGYAKNLVDLTADSNDGLAYCRTLPAGESKRFCYVAIGEQIWVLEEAPEQRDRLCRAAEDAYIGACRHGAGLGEEAAANGSGAIAGRESNAG